MDQMRHSKRSGMLTILRPLYLATSDANSLSFFSNLQNGRMSRSRTNHSFTKDVTSSARALPANTFTEWLESRPVTSIRASPDPVLIAFRTATGLTLFIQSSRLRSRNHKLSLKLNGCEGVME